MNRDRINVAELSRRAFVAAGFAAIASGAARAATGYHLVMVEEPGCVYCARWHAEVGPAYANSPEGRFAPLQRERLGSAALAHLKGLRYTPTFVLTEGDREIGRIVGYPGADFFWALLADLLAKTTYRTPAQDDIKT